MTDKADRADNPDVEAIIEEIRSHVRQAEEDFPAEDLTALESERNLKANLGVVNEAWEVGALEGTGPVSMLRRPVYKVLGALIGEINNFNSNAARVLNRLVKILEGSDTEGSEELLTNARRRLTLLARLSERLERYDELQIDTRLEKIEKALSDLEDRVGRGGAAGE
jgi:hypothetical protein